MPLCSAKSRSGVDCAVWTCRNRLFRTGRPDDATTLLVPSINSSCMRLANCRCLRCLLLVMCTHPFAKKALTLHLARGEGRERYFGCNLMQRKVLASSHQHLMAEAPDFAFVCALISAFKALRKLALENVALRQQVAVLRRSVKRTRLSNVDREFWVLLRRIWTDWESCAPQKVDPALICTV